MNWWRDKSYFQTTRRRSWLVLLTFVCLTATAWACGPYFPRWLLSNSDQSVQAVPVASFFKEVAVWRQGKQSRFKVVPPKEEQTQAQQMIGADARELRAALQQDGVNAAKAEQIVKAHLECREKLRTHAEAMAAWLEEPFDWEKNLLRPMPDLGRVSLAAGLPPEFADYMRGSVAYHNGKTNEAVAAWTALLKRPAGERHYRSTWAEYMLGRAGVDTVPEEAVRHFQQVRALVGQGFADATGLAAASLGWEARAWLRLKDYRRAIQLYSEQIAAGDDGHAVVSLRRTVAAALDEGEPALKILADDPTCRRLVTAALISEVPWSEPGGDPPEAEEHQIWLRLLEEKQAVEVELAEQLALAAYQTGKYMVAERWLKRAPQTSAAARWLQAKLMLRDGKVEEAAGQLAKLSREFPPLPAEALGTNATAVLLDRLQTGEAYDVVEPVSARQTIQGELGVLQLHRRDYVTSLDCLLRGDYWMDAAYVAERVLTVDELKTYVDRQWPWKPARERKEDEFSPPDLHEQIRYLLARRLTRADRFREATEYYPQEFARLHKERWRWFEAGHDAKRPAKERARALWEAAKLTRQQGLELIGTEVEPDWAVYGGNFEVGVSVEGRWQQRTNSVLPTTKEELQRAVAHEVAPSARWHYRYQAADLAWQAAALMPDQSEETAKMLYEAGSWLKGNDPKAANRFYRALVLRCNKTELGRMAKKLRWFPPLDENGKSYIPKRKPKAVEPVESFPVF